LQVSTPPVDSESEQLDEEEAQDEEERSEESKKVFISQSIVSFRIYMGAL
jgi:hypothetical protein